MDNNNNEDDFSNSNEIKCLFILSLVLITMDILELYYSYIYLLDYSKTLSQVIFNQCVKYSIITQIFFTVFATLAALSFCLISFLLFIDSEFFALKLIDSFMYYNFFSFCS